MMPPSRQSPENDPFDDVAAHDAELPALGWVRRAHAQDELLAEVANRVRERRRRRWALGASSVTIAILGAFFWRGEMVPAPAVIGNHSPTATILEPRRQTLPDGSIVELNDSARIATDFTNEMRRVILWEGEAHFQVAKNRERPFVVVASGVEVRAVGTAFSVQIGASQVEVLVTEGKVQVAPPTESRLAPTATSAGAKLELPIGSAPTVIAPSLLEAGHRAVIAPAQIAPAISTVSAVELADRLSWRIPQLEFSRTPLDEVVALMNEHTGIAGVRFVIADPSLRNVRVSGFLRADNSAGLAHMLEANFKVKAERTDGTITLRRR